MVVERCETGTRNNLNINHIKYIKSHYYEKMFTIFLSILNYISIHDVLKANNYINVRSLPNIRKHIE